MNVIEITQAVPDWARRMVPGRRHLSVRFGGRGDSPRRATAVARDRTGQFLWWLVLSVLVCCLCSGRTFAATVLFRGHESAHWQDALAEQDWLTLAQGEYHTLALARDGSVHAWGDNYYGQCNVPVSDRLAGIAAGKYHSLALRHGGSLAAWGDNTRGQCLVPAGQGFIAVGTGHWHCLAIRSDGGLVAWGCNGYGQCDVPDDKKCTVVCGGHGHSLALTEEGALVAWGNNADGQCNVPEGEDFTGIAAGAFHNVALRQDGSLVAWGRNDDGQCDVPDGEDFVAVAAGAFHSLALRADGTLMAWGHNGYGQCDVPTDHGLSSIRAGGYMSLAIVAGPTENRSVAPLDLVAIFARLTDAADGLVSRVKGTIVSAAEAGKVIPNASKAALSVDKQRARLEDHAINAPPAEDVPGATAPRDEVRVSATEGDEGASADASALVTPPAPASVASTSEGLIHLEAESTRKSEPDKPAAETGAAKRLASVVSRNVMGVPSHGARMVSRSSAKALMAANASVPFVCVGAGAVAIGLVLLGVVYFRRRVPRPSARGQPVQEDDKDFPLGMLPEELEQVFTRSSAE